jgi:hypothetical protein
MSLQDSGRAIGAVTRLLQDHLIRRGFDISIGKPEDATGGDGNPKLNLFLFEVGIDAHLRNQPLRDGERAPLWLVLRYLLTAFDTGGISDDAAAHELLGRGMSALQQLAVLPLDAAVAADVRLALERSPEPLRISFDDSGVDLLSKIMQGSEEHYRVSIVFQVRPVLIAPATLSQAALLVGVDYTKVPETIVGREGVQITTIPSLAANLDYAAPQSFEAGASFTVFGDDIGGTDIQLLLGDVPLATLERHVDRVVVRAEGSAGAPIASGTTLSAGELPLVARRALPGGRVRSSNLLAVRLLPTVTDAAFAGADLVLHGVLLGAATDDVVVILMRADDGSVVRQFDVTTVAADQHTLTVPAARTGLAAGDYRVLLRVNNQQARAARVVSP